jgi:hypothetical protein
LFLIINYFSIITHPIIDGFADNILGKPANKKSYDVSYLTTLDKDRNEVHFPYRYTQDENGNILPLVMVSAFFRDDLERARFKEYTDHGIRIVGITAYKTFPKPITDVTGDSESSTDPFDYFGYIFVLIIICHPC